MRAPEREPRAVRPWSGLARAGRVIAFGGFFLLELVSAGVRVAVQIVLPASRLRPAIIAVPLDLESDAGITFLANVLSLVPGTLSLDVSEDRRTLFVHLIHLPGDDADEARRRIKGVFERRIVGLLR